jgi:hypothetical protein
MAGGIQSPEKELRFTRARQAVPFWVLGAVASMAAVTLLATAAYRSVNPALPHPLWALVPAVVAAGTLRLALHLTRRAYLILTPLGMEIFPFFRPAAGMRLIPWQEIDEVELDEGAGRLTLHCNRERTAGIHLSLRPVPRERWSLLAKAVSGRVSRVSASAPS